MQQNTTNQNTFEIGTVVELDLAEFQKRPAAHGYNIDCPFCGRKNKLNINPSKNVWCCPACGTGGGPVKLHALLHDEDTNWAVADLERVIKTGAVNPVSANAVPEQPKEHKACDLKMRSEILTEFLKNMPVSQRFFEELSSEKRGGLTYEEVKALGYGSYYPTPIVDKVYGKTNPAELAVIRYFENHGMKVNDPSKAPEIFARYFSNPDVGIPGFKLKDGHIVPQSAMNCDFLPVRSRNGEISYLQTKFPKLNPDATEEQKIRYKKYGRYASYGPTGCTTSELETIHYTLHGFDRNRTRTPGTVWLTEGILKADIASLFSNRPFIALVGISVYSQLSKELKYLKDNGTKTIVIATDMDYEKNESVRRSTESIINIVKRSGLHCKIARWNPEYKGIDDFLIAVKKGVVPKNPNGGFIHISGAPDPKGCHI